MLRSDNISRMELKLVFSEDPPFVLSRAGVFLSSQPVLHNLVLSILHARVAQGDSGRYWMAIQRDDVVGVVLQSPLTFPATLTPMEPPVATAMADAIADAGIRLPGVNGEAATAAIFSGQWSERSKSAATPFQGNRLYELLDVREVHDIEGTLRRGSALSSKIVQTPFVSSLDTLHGELCACAALANANRFSPGLHNATFAAAAACDGRIEHTDATPKA
jgi:hypothetical protein